MKKIDLKMLIQPLLSEYKERFTVTLPDDEPRLKQMYRSLVNVRQPGYGSVITKEWLEMQDAYLAQELEQKGIVRVEEIPAVKDQYHIPVKPMYLQKKMKASDEFTLFHSDKICLWKGDITRLQADAIVNAANSQLLGCFIPNHNCIDNVIHTAAGVQLREECAEIMRKQGHEERNGFAKITKGYNLPATYVLHTVGPCVRDYVTDQDERELASCYSSCLSLAEEYGLHRVVFCCISTGVFHFPAEQAAKIAIQTVDEFLDTSSQIQQVVFDVYTDEDLAIYEHILQEVK